MAAKEDNRAEAEQPAQPDLGADLWQSVSGLVAGVGGEATQQEDGADAGNGLQLEFFLCGESTVDERQHSQTLEFNSEDEAETELLSEGKVKGTANSPLVAAREEMVDPRAAAASEEAAASPPEEAATAVPKPAAAAPQPSPATPPPPASPRRAPAPARQPEVLRTALNPSLPEFRTVETTTFINGYLVKRQPNTKKSWRWFVFDKRSGILSDFTDHMAGAAGTLTVELPNLRETSILRGSRTMALTIQPPGEQSVQLVLKAASSAEARIWIEGLEDARLEYEAQQRQQPPPSSSGDQVSPVVVLRTLILGGVVSRLAFRLRGASMASLCDVEVALLVVLLVVGLLWPQRAGEKQEPALAVASAS